MSVTVDDELDLMYRAWNADEPKAVVLLVHGLGAHGARWEDLAQCLLVNNISSYAIELKGFGDTPGRRGDISSFSVYLSDILSLYSKIKFENPDVPVFICGESMGGIIAYTAALEYSDMFAGYIGVSPAFKGRLKFTLLQYIGVGLFVLLYPKKLFNVPFSSQMCTQDTEYLDKMNADEREHRFASARFLIKLLSLQKKAVQNAINFKVPSLIMIPENDTVVVSDVTKIVFKTIAAKDKKIKEYSDMYHALTIDLNRKQIFDDIVVWLNERI